MTALGNKVRPEGEPLFVSYYTDDFYKNCFETWLRPSLERHELQFEVDHVPSLGSWMRNELYKAEFILKKIRQHPERDLVWVDVDAEVKARPDLFFDPEVGEIAACYWPHTFNNVPMLFGGTILFRGTSFVERIVEQWVLSTARSDGSRLDQQLLQDILEAYQDVVFDLPSSYCWIESVMRPLRKDDQPIVLHHHVAKERFEKK